MCEPPPRGAYLLAFLSLAAACSAALAARRLGVVRRQRVHAPRARRPTPAPASCARSATSVAVAKPCPRPRPACRSTRRRRRASRGSSRGGPARPSRARSGACVEVNPSDRGATTSVSLSRVAGDARTSPGDRVTRRKLNIDSEVVADQWFEHGPRCHERSEQPQIDGELEAGRQRQALRLIFTVDGALGAEREHAAALDVRPDAARSPFGACRACPPKTCPRRLSESRRARGPPIGRSRPIRAS